MYQTVKDSGQRQSFSTGSVRDTRDGKGRFDLLSPIVLQRDAKHMENGAKKYGDRNWEKGQPLSRFMDSAMRHIIKYMEGHRDEDHLSAARWNLGCVVHVEEMIKRGKLDPKLNDLVEMVDGTLNATPEKEEKDHRHEDYCEDWVSSAGSLNGLRCKECGLQRKLFEQWPDGQVPRSNNHAPPTTLPRSEWYAKK